MDVHGWVFTLYLRFCVWPLSGKNILLFTFSRSVSNAQFFLGQIYVCNGTNKRIKNKLEVNLYVCTLRLDLPLSGSVIYNEANPEMHTRQADLFNLISH